MAFLRELLLFLSEVMPGSKKRPLCIFILVKNIQNQFQIALTVPYKSDKHKVKQDDWNMTSGVKNIQGKAVKISRKIKRFTDTVHVFIEGILNSAIDKLLPVISEKVTIKVLNVKF